MYVDCPTFELLALLKDILIFLVSRVCRFGGARSSMEIYGPDPEMAPQTLERGGRRRQYHEQL